VRTWSVALLQLVLRTSRASVPAWYLLTW
jgi:hypothetical protein